MSDRGPLATQPIPHVVAVLVLAMVASSTMQFSLGVLGPSITKDLGLSPAEFGFLPATLFAVAVVTSLFSARILGFLGIGRSVLAIFAITAGCFAFVIGVGSYFTLLLAVGGMGMALALGNPATNQAIVAYVAPKRHGRAVGAKQAGVQVAALMTGIVLPPLTAVWGWRLAVQVITALSILGVAYTLIVFRGATFVPRTVRAAGPAAPTGDLRLAAYGFLMGAGMGATNGFLPLYAHTALRFDEQDAGLLISCIGLLGVASRYLWGWLGDRRPDPAAALSTLAAAAAVSVIPIVASASTASWLVWLGAVGIGLTAVAWNSVAMVTALKRSAGDPSRLTARIMLGFFLGLLTGPIVMGYLTTATSYPIGWLTVLACYATSSLLIIRS